MVDGKRIIETVEKTAELPPCKTADEMYDICCESAGELRCCKVVTPDWDGYSQQEFLDYHGIVLDELGRDSDGRYVTVEDFPRTGPCGEEETDYDVRPLNCCDQIPEMIEDEDHTDQFIEAGKFGHVSVLNGSGTYTWESLSAHLYIGLAARKVVTTSQTVQVRLDADACGKLAVRVSDGCRSLTIVIQSTLGHWEFRVASHYNAGGLVGCHPTFYNHPLEFENANASEWTVIKDGWKQIEWASEMAYTLVNVVPLGADYLLDVANSGPECCADSPDNCYQLHICGPYTQIAIDLEAAELCFSYDNVRNQIARPVLTTCHQEHHFLVSTYYATHFHCENLLGGGNEGSTAGKAIFPYRKNYKNRQIYEWVC